MLQKLIEYIKQQGLPLPHAYDPVSKEQSFRLLTAYVSFVLCVLSLVALHFKSEILIASAMSIGFFALNMVFYMLKKLQSAKIDLNDQEFSINAEKDSDSQ